MEDNEKERLVGKLKASEFQKIGECARSITKKTKFTDELPCARSGLTGRCLDAAGSNPEKRVAKLHDNEHDTMDDFLLDHVAVHHKRTHLSPAAYKMLVYASNETRSKFTKIVKDEVAGEPCGH